MRGKCVESLVLEKSAHELKHLITHFSYFAVLVGSESVGENERV